MREAAEIEHAGTRVQFCVLGPLTVRVGDHALPLGPLKQRAVLATLLCAPNRFVPVDELTEAVWADEPPRTARKNLQVYISALRRTLAPTGDRLVHGPGGYLIRLAEPELDSLAFQALARSARQAAADGSPEAASALLDRARRLWHGPPLPELRCSEPLQTHAGQLTNRYLSVSEDWAEAALRTGRAQEVVEAVGELVDAHPFRERLRAIQMTALHRAGRRTEALAVFDDVRQGLSRELGLSPSPVLRALHQSILDDEDAGAPAPARPLPALTALPDDAPDFEGRSELLSEVLSQAVGGGSVTVVVGSAGSGKTALALHAAHRLGDEFPGGRIFVRLRTTDGTVRPAASVLCELLAHAGLQDVACEDAEQAGAHWRRWLAERRLLLVLDDAADEAHLRPILPGTGRSAAIVTSRGLLAGLAPAHRLQVPPMTVGEALDMLGRLIGVGRVLCDRAAAERIVTACGLLPLAVRAAGLKLAVLRHLPLAEYADRLTDPRELLDELVVGDLRVRSRVAAEWEELGERKRSVLLGLASMPLAGRFTVDAAAAALGYGSDRALRELELMIEAGAVVSPAGEVTAHAAEYCVPYLTHLYAREVACRTV
ncbi:BTAD domain-containing putative transcriptional regulator [Streptomyces griseorubiginosus]|uniref:AfsR/SARP family transcriptional regulator n=1 Tax=Streptomyces griseorubiginosus TaxID=67304 RepID=UPI0033A2887A